MKETVVSKVLVLWLILVHIFSPRKDKARCPVFVFCSGIFNAIYGLALYSSILVFKVVIAMQEFTPSKTESQFIFLK